MQIERTGTPVVAAAGKAGAAETKTTQQDSSKTTPGTTATPLTGGNRAVSLGLLEETDTDTYASLPADFAEMVAEKSHQFSLTLTEMFKGLDIRMDEPITLSINSIGKVIASGPGKAKIEKLFEENPELAKQLKEVITLQAILAMKIALDHYAETRKKATSDKERDQAQNDLLADLSTIKALRNTMVLADGELTSAALAAMNDRYCSN